MTAPQSERGAAALLVGPVARHHNTDANERSERQVNGAEHRSSDKATPEADIDQTGR
jgi:hypothetical protein